MGQPPDPGFQIHFSLGWSCCPAVGFAFVGKVGVVPNIPIETVGEVFNPFLTEHFRVNTILPQNFPYRSALLLLLPEIQFKLWLEHNEGFRYLKHMRTLPELLHLFLREFCHFVPNLSP